ncbi:hypothetical protein ABPG74_009692 [Tetrahymena malaccensis]
MTEQYDQYESNGIKTKRQIAKVKKTKSKSFKQKPFVIVPIYQNRFSFDHKFMLFGYVQIETQYKNFDNPFDEDLIPVQDQMFSVKSIVLSQDKKMVEMSVETNIQSGMKDFSFLINHFNTIPDQNFRDLGQQLMLYQQHCIQQQNHFKDIQDKLKSRILNEEDILNAVRDYEIYVDNYVQQNLGQNEFYLLIFTTINYETLDYEIKKYKASLSLLQLLGIDLKNSSSLKLLQALTQETRLQGVHRLQKALEKMRLLSERKISYQQPLITQESIQFNTQIDIDLLEWPNKPDFLENFDLFGFVCKITVCPKQIQSILKLREAKKKNLNNQQSNNLVHFEQEVQSEIFLEKFYPSMQSYLKYKQQFNQ